MRSYLAGEVNDELANQCYVVAYDQVGDTLSRPFKFAGALSNVEVEFK